MIDIVNNVWLWIREDYRSWPLRFVAEFTAWLISVGCAVVMAITIPHPPFLILYPLFIAGCGMMAWADWTRRSFGMLANYVLLVTIDTIGLTRLLLS